MQHLSSYYSSTGNGRKSCVTSCVELLISTRSLRDARGTPEGRQRDARETPGDARGTPEGRQRDARGTLEGRQAIEGKSMLSLAIGHSKGNGQVAEGNLGGGKLYVFR